MSWITKYYCDICNHELEKPREIKIYIDGKLFKELQLCPSDYEFAFDLILGFSDKINLEKSKRR